MPFDSIATDVLDKVQEGLQHQADYLATVLHMNYSVMNAANNLIEEGAQSEDQVMYGFSEPARYQGKTLPIRRTGEWFLGDSQAPDCGISITLAFGEARRLSTIGMLS